MDRLPKVGDWIKAERWQEERDDYAVYPALVTEVHPDDPHQVRFTAFPPGDIAFVGMFVTCKGVLAKDEKQPHRGWRWFWPEE